jgi:hypothetical protein
MPLFKNLDRPLPVREQLADSAARSCAESLKTCARLTGRWVGQIFQRLEAGQ